MSCWWHRWRESVVAGTSVRVCKKCLHMQYLFWDWVPLAPEHWSRLVSDHATWQVDQRRQQEAGQDAGVECLALIEASR